jgi:MFS family permease
MSTAAAAPSGFDRRLIPPMVLGAVLNPINSSIIAVALVPIAHALGAPPSQTAWLVSALYITTAVGQPLVGRLVDVFGPRPLYLAGTGLVGVAGVLGMLAPNLGVLIAARVLLGLGTCAGYPAAMSLIRSESARTHRRSPTGVLTVLTVSSQTISVIGPTLGGLLIGVGGWRATLAVNVPLAVACLILGALRLPRAAPAPSDGMRLGTRLDLAGVVAFAGALVALLLFLMQPEGGTLWLLGAAVLLAAAFVGRELTARSPFIDLRVLAGNRPLLATYLRNLLASIVSYAFLYGFTQWLEEGYGLTPSGAGLLLLPLFAVAILVSATTGRRPEIRAKLVVGSVGQVAACALLLVIGPTSPVVLLLVLGVVLGLPQGLVSLANQTALYHQADPARTGSSAGLLRTSLYLGAIIASAANGFVFGAHVDTMGLHELAVFLLVVAFGFLVVTVADRSLGRVAVAARAAS